MSSRLTSESRMYADKAKDLNRQVCPFYLHHAHDIKQFSNFGNLVFAYLLTW